MVMAFALGYIAFYGLLIFGIVKLVKYLKKK